MVVRSQSGSIFQVYKPMYSRINSLIHKLIKLKEKKEKMEINIEDCKKILEKKTKLTSKNFDKKLTSSKHKTRRFSQTEVNVIFKASVDKFQKLDYQAKFDHRSQMKFGRWLNGDDHQKSFIAERVDAMSTTRPSKSSSQMSVDDVESEEEMLKRENSELKEQLRLAREHIDRQAKKTDLFQAGAKLFVKQFNQLHRGEVSPIFVFPCTMHMVANGVGYIAKELSEDATDTMARLRRVLGGRETGNYNKHSLCEAFKSFANVSSPFESNLGCRYTHWPANGQNLVDFEPIIAEILEQKKTLTSEQMELKSLMKSDNWEKTLLECGALFAAYEYLLLPFDIAVKSSNTTVGQLKIAMNDLMTKMNLVEMNVGLENIINLIGERTGDVGEALGKLVNRFNLPENVAVQNEVDDFLTRAVARLRIKVVKDFKLMSEAIDCGLSDDCIIPFHNRASERSFAVMKAINKRLGTMTKENCFTLAIARQNRLSCYLSTLSDIGELTTEARSKRNDLLEKRRERYNQLARERLASEFDIVDFEE